MIILSTAFARQRKEGKRREGGKGKAKGNKRCSRELERRRGGGREGGIKRVGHSVYMHACERLSTDSACGMSRWVTDMLESPPCHRG